MHVLLTEDQELFRRTVREFAEREIAPVAAELDESERYPRENVKKIGLKTVYDRAAYDLSLDYHKEPVPPLERADAKWARELLRGQGGK